MAKYRFRSTSEVIREFDKNFKKLMEMREQCKYRNGPATPLHLIPISYKILEKLGIDPRI